METGGFFRHLFVFILPEFLGDCQCCKKSRGAGFFIYALWRLMAADISSSDALHGNTGSNHTWAVPLCIRPCFGQYFPASVPTGKIGNFNSWAKNSNPRFNFTVWPGLTRVPSGKMINTLPSMIFFATAWVNFCMFVAPRARFTGCSPMRQNAHP